MSPTIAVCVDKTADFESALRLLDVAPLRKVCAVAMLLACQNPSVDILQAQSIISESLSGFFSGIASV